MVILTDGTMYCEDCNSYKRLATPTPKVPECRIRFICASEANMLFPPRDPIAEGAEVLMFTMSGHRPPTEADFEARRKLFCPECKRPIRLDEDNTLILSNKLRVIHLD